MFFRDVFMKCCRNRCWRIKNKIKKQRQNQWWFRSYKFQKWFGERSRIILFLFFKRRRSHPEIKLFVSWKYQALTLRRKKLMLFDGKNRFWCNWKQKAANNIGTKTFRANTLFSVLFFFFPFVLSLVYFDSSYS